MRNALPASLALLTLSLLVNNAIPAQAAAGFANAAQYGRSMPSLQVVGGHLRPEIVRAPLVGVLPPSTRLHLAIGLPLRNRAESEALAAAVSEPGSPDHHRYLTPAQFAMKFSPTVSDYQAVIAFARASHFSVTRTYPNRIVLSVEATVSAIQQAFHLTMQARRRPDGSVFYAPSNDPALALRTPILHVTGLDNYRLPKPMISSLVRLPFAPRQRRHTMPNNGPGGTLAGPDFRNAYAPGAPQNGIGQCISLLEFNATFFPADIAQYQADFGEPALIPQQVLLDGFNGIPVVSSGEQETALDIEVAQAMAPNVQNIFVFEGSNENDILSAMATGPLCNQLSASWTFSVDSTSQQLVTQMAVQGQSLFVSSGDSGGFTTDPGDDRDLPNLTVVGGTHLTFDGKWISEVAWPASGGGPESGEYVPPYQKSLKVEGQHSRMIPDVAMAADNTFLIADNGMQYSVAGTSISSPLWAGYTALINQQAQAVGEPPFGFINPPLYAIARNPAAYAKNFHDITSGNNGAWSTLVGYDMVTGLGSPQGQLISTLNPVVPPANFNQLQIKIYTGSDNLRADSDLQVGFTGIANLTPFCLMRSNNGQPSGICTGNAYGDINGVQGWDSWSTRTLTYINHFANWKWAGSGTMTLTMTSHNNGFETNDNWDIQAMTVTLTNTITNNSVTLFSVGNFNAPHVSGNCYWRFKPTGSPPIAKATFNLLPGTTPSNGCPND